jgi:hypothetical protein
MNRAPTCLMALLCAMVSSSAAFAQTIPQLIRGDVAAMDGRDLRVRSSNGQELTVRMPDHPRINVRVPATLDLIRPGVYVGVTAAAQPDGTLVASEVHIFPESARGTGEGHRPLATLPGSTMTNATVAAVSPGGSASRGTMTNATVADVARNGQGRTLKLTYTGGEKTIAVPDNVPVVTSEAGEPSSLTPGNHVIVYAARNPDGTLSADRISVGKNGSVPPV